MTEYIFKDVVIRQFDFLENQYGFSFDVVPNSTINVSYRTNSCRVSFMWDNRDHIIFARLGPTGELMERYIKEDIDSGSIAIRSIAGRVGVATFDAPGFGESDWGDLEKLEKYLAYQKKLLQETCVPFLKGDFTYWPEIVKGKLGRFKKKRYFASFDK